MATPNPNKYLDMYNTIMGAKARVDGKQYTPVANVNATVNNPNNDPVPTNNPNVPGLATVTQMKTPEQYQQMAGNQYDPIYNQQRQALLNALASQKQAYEASKTGVNLKYNDANVAQNLSNTRTKNNISNTALGRGLSRGTIVTSGLAEADMVNNRVLGDLEKRRMGELGDIDSRIAMLQENNANNLARLDTDKAKMIADLARQLEDRDYDKNYKDRTLNFQMDSEMYNRDFNERKFDYQKLSDEQNRAMEQAKFDYQKQQDEINNTFRKDSFEWQKAMEQAKFDYQKQQDIISQSNWEKDFGLKQQEFYANNDYRKQSLAMQQAEKKAKESELSNWEATQQNSMADFFHNTWNNSDGSSISYDQKAKYFEDVARNYASVGREDYRRLSQIASQYAKQLRDKASSINNNSSRQKPGGNKSYNMEW